MPQAPGFWQRKHMENILERWAFLRVAFAKDVNTKI
jgi:hypothetical protein